MDQALLVGAGQTIVKALDDHGIPPRAAMWVHNEETDAWKLWVVPSSGNTDQRTFYRKIAEIISHLRNELGELDASDTEMVSAKHPAFDGLRHVIKMPGLGSARFTNNQFNGFFLPDGIIIRMDL